MRLCYIQQARQLGIPVVDFQLVKDRNKYLDLLIKHFDWVIVGGSILLNAAQLLNILPARKYGVLRRK